MKGREGATPSAGHYRAMLLSDHAVNAGMESCVSDELLCDSRYTDDGSIACKVQLSDVSTICCNSYLCWFARA